MLPLCNPHIIIFPKAEKSFCHRTCRFAGTSPHPEEFPLPSASRAVPTFRSRLCGEQSGRNLLSVTCAGRIQISLALNPLSGRTEGRSNPDGTSLSRQEQVALPHHRPAMVSTKLPTKLYRGHSLNIAQERIQPRDTFTSLLHPTHTYISLDGGHATKLCGGGLPSFLILCAQERAVRGTHLGLPCTQPTPLKVSRRPRYHTGRRHPF